MTSSGSSGDPRSILVVRLGAMGDVVRTLPAVSCLRRAHPSARIAWAVEAPSREILEGHPDVDEVLVLERRLLAAGPADALRHLRSYSASLRGRRFDWAIDFQGTLKSAIVARLSGAGRSFGLGRGHARELAHLLYSDPVPLPREPMSRVTRALRLVAATGADTAAPRLRLPAREGPGSAVRPFLDQHAPRRPRVVLSPGTSEPQSFKRYPADLFSRLADGLVETAGATIVLAWGPGEIEIAEKVRRGMRHPAVLAPPTSLPELAELIRACDLFVGSDTGPLHLAAAVGAAVVAIYGPTSPAVNAPYTDRPRLSFVGDVTCRPCRNRGCLNRSCLRLVDPSLVAAEAARLLAAGPSGGPAAQGAAP